MNDEKYVVGWSGNSLGHHPVSQVYGDISCVDFNDFNKELWVDPIKTISKARKRASDLGEGVRIKRSIFKLVFVETVD